MSIQINNITKTFGSFKALDEINLNIETGELVALLGPSGSGKTSLLRIIAGLEAADEGNILFENTDMTTINTKERNVGFVFQHYALFRHMNVFDNIAYGLKVRPRSQRPSKKQIKEKVEELLHLVKLDNYADRFPGQLSGGQRQRVALARALAVEPKVLLLDEPFGALDAKVRKDLRRWLRRLHDDFHITSIFVTHDQEEALDVADRIVVMNEGRIEQVGSPEEVYDTPNNPFVFDFLGNVNIFPGRLHNGKLSDGSIAVDAPEFSKFEHTDAVGYVRPHDIHIDYEDPLNEAVESTVVYLHSVGPLVRVELRRNDTNEYLEAEIPKELYRNLNIKIKDIVYVKPKQLKVFIPQDYTI